MFKSGDQIFYDLFHFGTRTHHGQVWFSHFPVLEVQSRRQDTCGCRPPLHVTVLGAVAGKICKKNTFPRHLMIKVISRIAAVLRLAIHVTGM